VGHPVSKETIAKIIKANTGRKQTDIARNNMSKARLGKAPWNKGLAGLGICKSAKGRKATPETRAKISRILSKRVHTLQSRLKRRAKMSGERSNWWQGGITPLYYQIRHLIENKLWREAIFRRDDFTCQKCNKRGVWLEAHHLKSFSTLLKEFLSIYNQFSPQEDKETLVRLAMSHSPFWDITNGITLCGDCHNKTKNHAFRKANDLAPKFEKVEPIAE
jgi:5-methylcytosine-specific restriction endonuclease McrA